MLLIPVIDLLRGQVVRGVRGDRQAYRPIDSALCASSDPVTVARVLCEHCDARQLYIADLDALMGGPAQRDVLRSVLLALPEVEVWLDAGFADAAAAHALQAGWLLQERRAVPVFGSETLASAEALQACFAPQDPLCADAVLSLDRRDGQRLDAAGCWSAVNSWPKRVIVMTMERVGSAAGPDLETMREIRRKAPAAWLIGAGGVRSQDDLLHAAEAGADAWLVASALHDLQLPRVRR
jgi:HisA/HisF family protein